MTGRWGLGALALLVASATTGCGGEGEAPDAAGADLPAQARELQEAIADPRLAPLYAACATSGPYTVDTAQMADVLAATLERGTFDPMKRAKVELAGMGPRGLEPVERLLERHFQEPDGAGYVRNALDVAALADPEGPGAERARAMVLRGMEHASPSVRGAALPLLARHGRPEDFARVVEAIGVSTPELRRIGIGVLHALDPERAERMYVDALLSGTWDLPFLAQLEPETREREVQRLLDQVVPLLASSSQPDTLERARRAWREVDPKHGPYLIAAAARAGDEDARAELAAQLAGPREGRGAAVDAAAAAGLVDLLGPVLAGDPDPLLRRVAAGTVGAAEPSPERDGWLRNGARDADPDVRFASLAALVRRGDGAAVDELLGLLRHTDHGELERALGVLRERWDEEPRLADRALAELLARHAGEAHRPLAERARLLHAIGLVPRVEAAAFLADLARTAEGELQGVRAHRWLVLRAGNAGPDAQRLLADRYEAESDAVRRLDLLEAFSAGAGEVARERLVALLDEERARPAEAPYAADRLVRLGPGRDVAPLLKRVALRTGEPTVQRALQCLLWTWYPAPTE